MKSQMKLWAKSISRYGNPVTPYFIELNIKQVEDEATRDFLNQIPTSFSLTDQQVDTLIETGRDLLKNNEEFQQLLSDIDAERL